MARRIQGITIELDGDSTSLQKALKDVDKSSKVTTKELSQIDRALKFDPGNTVLLQQKMDVLSDSISNTSTKLDTLKRAQAEVNRQFKAGEIDATTYREFQREIEITEGKLKAFRKQADDVKAKINVKADVGDIDKVESKLKGLGPAAAKAGKDIAKGITVGLAGVATAIGGVAIGTQELNTDLARLKTNAELAGRDMGLVEKAFKEVAAVSGETDSAVETISNLLASGFSDEQLSQVIDNVNGAAIRFSDTLKTEGIADGIQETFATGKAIGQFGELLERSGLNLDDFNEKLENAKTEGDKANLILETMANIGLSDVSKKYKELNPEISASNEANLKLQKALADLGLALTPLVTFITDIITKLVEWINTNPVLQQTIQDIINAFLVFKDTVLAVWDQYIKPKFEEFVAFLIDVLLPAFESNFETIVQVVTTTFEHIEELWNTILHPALMTIIDVVQNHLLPAFETAFHLIVDVATTTFNSIKSIWETVLQPIFNVIMEIVEHVLLPLFQETFIAIGKAVSKSFNAISGFWHDVLKPVLTGITDFISGVFTGDWDRAWSGVVSTFEGIFKGVETAAKAPLNMVIEMINAVIEGMNSLSISIPDWVPWYGGQEWGINIPKIPMLAKGTDYFKGGMAIVGEKGPELVELPTGAKVHPNEKTQQILGQQQPPQFVVIQVPLDGKVISEAIIDTVSGKQYTNANINALTKGVTLV